MKIINSVVSWFMKKRTHQIELFKKFPHEVQQELFEGLVDVSKETEWGIKHNYQNIKTVKDFKSQVPVQDYESLRESILKIKHGQQNILWPTEIKWFAMSSGTTSDKSKFIPITKESLEDCHYKGGKDLLAIYFTKHQDSQLFAGKALALGGSSELNKFSPDSYYGDLSSIMIRNLPIWMEYARIPDVATSLNPNFEEKINTIASYAHKENVTSLSGVPTWNILLLQKILEVTGKDNLLEIWPNFELYAHGGVNFKPYQKTFEQFFPSDKVTYIDNYNASEGFFAIQDRWDSTEDDMLLMLDYGIFYEFMPMSEVDSKNSITIGLEDVELDTNYALIITTNGGLWRYMIGDTVKFTSLSPFRIQVSGRTKYYINAFGEEVVADNADKAVAMACEKSNAIIKDYTVAPVYFSNDAKGAHEWILEFEKEPEDVGHFMDIVDNTIKNLNSDYEAKRYNNLALESPKFHVAPKGTFYRWLKEKGKLGGQNKIPRLSNNRIILESILTTMNK